jgi:photosystem II stability/assembly factor-like uncharacterized protein
MAASFTRRGAMLSAAAVGACGLDGARPKNAPLVEPALPEGPLPAWTRLETEAFRGKKDDIVFVTPELGWYGHVGGRLYRTADGGASWTMVLDKPGTGFRALGFVDAQLGFAGNIGSDYVPTVTDTTPLYRTRDGGASWGPVAVGQGTPARGICAIDVVKTPFVNMGVLDTRTTIRAAGRVGGPAFLMESFDAGESWRSREIGDLTGMVLDLKFLDANVGFIAGASSANTAESNALVLKTTDGGRTWRPVYRSTRPYEITWKLAFPSRRVGYVTVQSYSPDKAVSQRYVAKTTDGGETWSELPVLNDHAFREFGIGFVDERRGWIGGSTTGVETIDGGATWRPVEMGRAVNKIRILRSPAGLTAYACGVDVYKLHVAART